MDGVVVPKDLKKRSWQNASAGHVCGPSAIMHNANAAHPGFKAVAAKIARQPGIHNAGAVLAARTRAASPAAKKTNPRLKRVKG